MPAMTQELFDQICARMSDGESTNAIIKDLSISWSSLQYFRENSHENVAKYASARELQVDWHAEEIKELSDEKPECIVDERGISRVDSGYVTWQKNRIDTRKWLMSKIAPKKYGDKQIVAVTGENGGAVKIDAVGVASTEVGAILTALAGAKSASGAGAAEMDTPVKTGADQT